MGLTMVTRRTYALLHIFRTQTLLTAVLALAASPSFAQMDVPAASSTIAASTTLTLVGLTSQSAITTETLKAMPHKTVTVINGHTNAQETWSGVPLIMLLAQVGAATGKDVHGKPLSQYIVATGADGYHAVLALAEIEPDFHPGDVLVADQLAGKPLDAKEGPFRLIVTEDKRPARSVHNLVKLELKQAE
jgi:hypothetical protein